MTIEQIMDIAERGHVNPEWLTEDEVRALALYLAESLCPPVAIAWQ